ncbi:hypothetical protein EX30DRAFT_365080 [Ascodesmis nigricans]|uniref:Fungal-type protein kinase domain-containing protein n=1 Tax=Ascodesmis nigricans TaxID=341454 RepID=A0A4S2MTJ6_9PEZI|nr:hypothetical protein EX30DRAFT_365080 [Ascodesmis nigricans]
MPTVDDEPHLSAPGLNHLNREQAYIIITATLPPLNTLQTLCPDEQKDNLNDLINKTLTASTETADPGALPRMQGRVGRRGGVLVGGREIPETEMEKAGETAITTPTRKRQRQKGKKRNREEEQEEQEDNDNYNYDSSSTRQTGSSTERRRLASDGKRVSVEMVGRVMIDVSDLIPSFLDTVATVEWLEEIVKVGDFGGSPLTDGVEAVAEWVECVVERLADVVGRGKDNVEEEWGRRVRGRKPTRRFIHAITLHGILLRLWKFDCGGAYASPGIHLTTETGREVFVAVVAAYLGMRKEDMGSIRRFGDGGTQHQERVDRDCAQRQE